MTITPTAPSLFSAFQQSVIDRVQINLGGIVRSYAEYLLLPEDMRGNDEANAVDLQFARYVLEWLGFQAADVSYNLPQAGQKANRPDYLVRGTIGTAFIWEDKNSRLDLEDEHIRQMRRYTTGTAGYAVWCNMRRILAVRFTTGDSTSFEQLADVDVAGLFGSQQLLETEREAQTTQLELFALLFSKQRFTQFNQLVARIAVDESTWRQHAQPLNQAEAINQFITGSRESLNHVRLAALSQIRDALSRRSTQATEEAKLRDEWHAACDKFVDVLTFEQVRQPVRAALQNLEPQLGELDNQRLAAIWDVVQQHGVAGKGSSVRPNFELWLERAVRVNSALLATRFQRNTNSGVVDAWRVWSERQSDPADKTPETFAEQVAYVFFVRLLLVRVLEDKGVLQPRLASDGGFQEWTAYIKHRFRELDGVSILHESYARLLTHKAEQYYLHFFQQGVFDWFLPDDFLFVETLEFLCRYDFQHVASDIIGFTYEEYIERNARNRKGHFLTRDEVVEYMLDLLGYTGGEMIGRTILDPASGSGSFLVHAARRYRHALLRAACEQAGVPVNETMLPRDARVQLARDFLHALTEQFTGMELNPFACYLAEMNLLIQSLDDLSLLSREGEQRVIERFQIYNTNSLDLPREILDSDDVAGNRSLLQIPDRLSDRLVDEAFPIKARLNGYGAGFFYIISNPPYVNSKQVAFDAERYRNAPFYRSVLSGDTNLYLLFLRLGLYYLADYGRMVFIQPLTLFGDSSASAARKLLNAAPFHVHAAVRFYRGDVLFPGVDQAVGIEVVGRSVPAQQVLISGGETVAQARAAETYTLPANVLHVVPTTDLWQGNWLVADDPAILHVWQHVKQRSNDLNFRLKLLLDKTFDSKQGDVNATYVNPLRVGTNGSYAQGNIAIYKGENVEPFAPLPQKPSDWVRTLGANTSAGKETVRASETLAAIAQLANGECGIVMRETARLNTRERLMATWFQRGATKPLAFEHTLWRMLPKVGVSEEQAKAMLAFFNSAVTTYILNLFSTNNHVTQNELNRLPIPDPTTFPAAELATLAEGVLAARATLERDFVERLGAVLPEAKNGQVYLPPSTVLQTWSGPKLTLGALRARGVLRLLGAETTKIEALRRRTMLRYTGSDAAVANMLTQFLDEPARENETWSSAQHWQLPDPVAAAGWHSHYGALVQAAHTEWHAFQTTQHQIDEAVADWYGFNSEQRATIAAGLPWARRRVPAPVEVLPPLSVVTVPAGATQRTIVQSSNIYAIGYDEATQTLEVEFVNGTVYQYNGVVAETWQQFQNEPSKGTFYNKRIKGKYEGREL